MCENNEKVRKAARVANIPLWKVATAIGIGETTLGRWLRVPLTEDREKRILAAISMLEKGDA